VNIVILAAGQGKRMQSQLPKVLHRLAGRPLLSHVLETARSLDARRICVVYGHGGETVREAFPDEQIVWVKQDPQRGTGHALMLAAPHLDPASPTLVLYGDVPLTRTQTLQKLCGTARNALGLLSVELSDPAGYGRVLRSPDGSVRRIVEDKDASAEERAVREVNTGILVAPTAKLKGWLERLTDHNAQKEYYLTDVVGMAVSDGTGVIASQPGAVWETLGVNSRAQLAELERIHQRNTAEALLAAGVALADPARIDVRGRLECGRDVEIDINCLFEGHVKLGDGVRIGASCVLRDIDIAAGTRVEPFCHLEEAQVGERCRIGPYARIRPGTRLAEDVHLGNFVEVKASILGRGTKANHLSYLGDSEIGRDVNVGAGTITCNYDGVNKHRTIIEDDVFIGSDTQLIAPVRVGKGATLAAGTTLVEDAPPGQLTLARARQVSKPNWKRPEKQKKG
jgi:bifunctional UDP-N-acetylglucosamine pyrophosphorylase / glucosamine-1-phosphate N-acetyltransferase